MSCCDEKTAIVPDTDVSRRSMLKGAALVTSLIPVVGAKRAKADDAKKVKLAFCSQLLCVVPYEIARSAGSFKNHGLDVELVYTRGGSAAMNALVGGAVDYAATALDVAIQAYAKGAEIRRFAVTGRLPLFALVTAPKTAATIKSVKDLEGKTVGVSALGNADHALLLYLLKEAKADAAKVQFATLGVNLLEALRQGQVDAGLVQEPALTLLVADKARVLVNAMDSKDANKYLGGSYEFMGVAVRAKEVEQRKPEMVALAKGLADGLAVLSKMTGPQITASLPPALTTGMDTKQLGDILVRYRESLYPKSVKIDIDAAKRVENTLLVGGLLKNQIDLKGLFDTTIVPS
jgi:NitT/TauT family transport system substrate-binding protein